LKSSHQPTSIRRPRTCSKRASGLFTQAERPEIGGIVTGESCLPPAEAETHDVAERPPFDHGSDRQVVGADLQALIAWLERTQR
jgi:hypothetical protein